MKYSFRRRESILNPGGGSEVNDRSCYEARTLFELDTHSAIGSIINSRHGIHRFLHDSSVREVWLDIIQRVVLTRCFERIMQLMPSIDDVTDFLVVSSRPQALLASCEQFENSNARLAKSSVRNNPYLEIVSFAVFKLVARNINAGNDFVRDRPELQLHLTSTKEHAVTMLVSWIVSHTQSPVAPITDFHHSLLLNEKHDQAKKSVLRCRQEIKQDLISLRQYISRYVSEIAKCSFFYQENGILPSNTVHQTHIPETILCDGFTIPVDVRRRFLAEMKQQLVPQHPKTKLEGTLVHLIDPSLCCRLLDDNAKRSRHFSTASGDEWTGAFSAFCRDGQSSSASMQQQPLSLGETPTYQWLPSDIVVHSTSLRVSITSEINSLHPLAFRGMYAGMEHLLAGFVPLFEYVLSSIATANPPSPILRTATSNRNSNVNSLSESHSEIEKAIARTQTRARCDNNHATRDTREASAAHHVFQPQGSSPILDSNTPVFNELPPAISLQGKRIQVIPRLSTIKLTPSQPRFTATSDTGSKSTWQIDGDSAEQLVAVGYHVLEHRNIVSPQLSFRAFAHRPNATFARSATPSAHEDANEVFLTYGEKVAGYHRGVYGRLFLQHLGSIALMPSRSLAVPAFIAHRLEPFELDDPTQDGCLTLLTFYLVDPTVKIPSTNSLEPEQHNRQWVEANVDMLRSLPKIPSSSSFNFPAKPSHHVYFPDEIARHIVDFATNGKENDEITRRRGQLEKERSRRHEIRFLHHDLKFQGLRVDLPDI